MTDDELDPYERLVAFNYLWRKFYIPAMEKHGVLEKAVDDLKKDGPSPLSRAILNRGKTP